MRLLPLLLFAACTSAPPKADDLATSDDNHDLGQAAPNDLSDCKDVMTSSLHCGRCGHSCLGGVCENGKCKALEVATSNRCPLGIAVDNDYVYWVTQGTRSPGNMTGSPDAQTGEVWRRAKTVGSAAEKLAMDHPMPHDVEVDATHIYFSDWQSGGTYGNKIVRIEKATKQLEIFASPSQIHPFGIGLGANDVYWASYDPGSTSGAIFSAPKNKSTAAAPLVTQQNQPIDVIVVGNNELYWTNYGKYDANSMTYIDGGIQKRSAAGVTTPLVQTEITLYGLAAHLDRIYFTRAFVPGSVRSVPMAGGGLMPLVTGPSEGVAVDASGVYVALHSLNQIVRVNTDGTGQVEIAGAQKNPHRVVVDAQGIYWTNYGTFTNNAYNNDGSVWLLAKE